MSGVDDRIVSMKFDNETFERKLSSTIQSLDRLRASLETANQTRGLQEINTAAQNINLSHIAGSVDTIKEKFNAMSVVAVAAITKITHQAVEGGQRMIKAFTMDPVKQGFQEFETNMNSIQTILANTQSKGSTLEDVNAALDQLNHYSDQTIYNFSEMARNIGTFTAAGVELDTAVASIKGIANLAALSGSNAQQAATAMYQLSQAIAAGTVKLMDWNSVVNAGMGGEIFQKALFETGKALGTLSNVPIDQTFEQWTDSNGAFRTSLSETGDAAASSAGQTAKATSDAARQIADAEESAAESIASAVKRAADAREQAAEVAEDAAERIADAEKDQAEDARRATEKIADAEENVADVFERTTESVERAAEDQARAVEQNANDMAKAIDAVTEAEERLKEALKPASEADMGSAEDRVTTAELDIADAANAISQAQQDQTRAAEDLAEAQAKLAAVNADASATDRDRLSASRAVEDAEERVRDLADAVERARLRQNELTRSLAEAEEKLAEAKQQGTDEDERVISAQEALEEARANQVRVTEENAEREARAAQAVRDADVESSEARQEAVQRLLETRAEADESAIESADKLTEAIEEAGKRQEDAAESVAEAEAAEAKAREKAQDSIARAHESAADRINSAKQSVAASGDKGMGWLTSDVLTTTLQAFTGDLDEFQLRMMGYTEEQAKEMIRLGEIGKASATEVKTFTQLLGTIKESVASGWMASFRTVVGDFDESKALFTGINNVVSEFVGHQADARNEMLQTWKDFGGRTMVIESFKNIIEAIGQILTQVSTAFREFFPKTTGDDLISWTTRFSEFTEKLKMGQGTLTEIRTAFRGVFAILDIGWEIVKGIFGVFGDLFGVFSSGGDEALGFAANAGEMAIKLHEALVEGGAIKDFFEKIGGVIKYAGERVKDFIGFVAGIFTGFAGAVEVGDSIKRVDDRLTHLKDSASGVSETWRRMVERFEGVKNVLDDVWTYISTWFKELGGKLADTMTPGDFDAAVDIVNVGLLGGIALMLKKFLDNGINLDFGGGMLEKISEIFGELTNTLKTMQTDLKAKALLKIAGAVGILTASVVALSLIDSAALTKAMVAMAVGFGQLLTAMALMDKLNMGSSAIKMNGMATAMTIMATAMGILSIAVTNLSQLSWEELAKGLGGVAVAMGIMITSMNLLTTDTGGMIRAGIAMAGMATSLVILAEAVEKFGQMSWSEMAKGLTGVAIGLGLITTAMNFMPPGMALTGAGLALVAGGLVLLAEAVESFAEMSWGEIGQGLIGIGGALVVIAGAMHLMPLNMPITAAGLVILSGALLGIAEAVEKMGNIKFGDMAKGIGGIAAMLVVLAGAMIVMNGTAAGAAAMVIAAGALLILSEVVEKMSQLSLGELAMGLGAMAGVFVILGGAGLVLGPLVPTLMGLGVALGLIGGSFALFGGGVMMVAKGLETLARSGEAGAKALIGMISVFVNAKVEIVQALVGAILEFAQEILDAAPLIIKSIKVILGHLLDTVIELTPKITEALGSIITEGLTLIREKYPEVLDTAFTLILTFLQGLRDNIPQIIDAAVEFLTAFTSSITSNMALIVTSAASIITSFLGELAEHAGDLVKAGLKLLSSILLGISDNLDDVIEAVEKVIKTFLKEVADSLVDITAAGLEALGALIKGVVENLDLVATMVGDIVVKFLTTLGEKAQSIIDAGTDLLVDFLWGIGNNLIKVSEAVGDIVSEFIYQMGESAGDIVQAGTDTLVDFLDGVADAIPEIAASIASVVTEILYQIGLKVPEVVDAGFLMFIALFDGLAEAIDERSGELGRALGGLAAALVTGIGDALKEAIKQIANDLFPGLGDVVDGIMDFFGIESPSKKFHWIGEMIMLGFSNGLEDNMGGPVDAVDDASVHILDKMSETMKKVAEVVDQDLDMSPTITPVIDLTKVRAGAKGLDRLMTVSAIVPSVSMDTARVISTTSELEKSSAPEAPEYAGPTEVTFIQNNYSPEALSTNDIYRGTNSQIALAKKELEIPA